MSAREGEIAELLARDALRRLVTTYSRAVDRRDFALLRSLYDDDARETHGAMFEGGPDDYVAFVKDALGAYEATTHYVLNTAFEVCGDTAQGEVHKLNYHRTRGPQRVEVLTGSRSIDRYTRRDGAWRFSARTVTLDFARREPVNADAYADFAANSPPGRPDAGDLSYCLERFARFRAPQGEHE